MIQTHNIHLIFRRYTFQRLQDRANIVFCANVETVQIAHRHIGFLYKRRPIKRTFHYYCHRLHCVSYPISKRANFVSQRTVEKTHAVLNLWPGQRLLESSNKVRHKEGVFSDSLKLPFERVDHQHLFFLHLDHFQGRSNLGDLRVQRSFNRSHFVKTCILKRLFMTPIVLFVGSSHRCNVPPRCRNGENPRYQSLKIVDEVPPAITCLTADSTREAKNDRQDDCCSEHQNSQDVYALFLEIRHRFPLKSNIFCSKSNFSRRFKSVFWLTNEKIIVARLSIQKVQAFHFLYFTDQLIKAVDNPTRFNKYLVPDIYTDIRGVFRQLPKARGFIPQAVQIGDSASCNFKKTALKKVSSMRPLVVTDCRECTRARGFYSMKLSKIILFKFWIRSRQFGRIQNGSKNSSFGLNNILVPVDHSVNTKGIRSGLQPNKLRVSFVAFSLSDTHLHDGCTSGGYGKNTTYQTLELVQPVSPRFNIKIREENSADAGRPIRIFGWGRDKKHPRQGDKRDENKCDRERSVKPFPKRWHFFHDSSPNDIRAKLPDSSLAVNEKRLAS